jgi:SAM-dependent methyltransferase
MREHVRAFVAIAARALQLRGPVYEFGSFLVAGQEALADLRPLFPGEAFVGCDLRAGRGVDRVEDLSFLSIADAAAQTIVCVETLEHVFEARRAVGEMLRVLAPGGAILLAAPLDFHIHGHPSDYWRLTPHCIERLLAPLAARLVGWQGAEDFPHTVYGIGMKAPISDRFAVATDEFVRSFQAELAAFRARRRWQHKLKESVGLRFRGRGQRRRVRDYHTAQFVLSMEPIPAAQAETSRLITARS